MLHIYDFSAVRSSAWRMATLAIAGLAMPLHAAKTSVLTLTPAGSVDTPGIARDVDGSGSTAYVSDFDQGLQIINAANPDLPTISGSYLGAETTYNAAVGASHLVVRGSKKTHLLNISTPSTPVFLSQTNDRVTPGPGFDFPELPPYATVILADRNLLALSNRLPGEVTQVYDITNPSAPLLRSSVLPSVGAAVQDGSGLIMVESFAFGGFYRADLTAPNAPRIVWRHPEIAVETNALDGVIISGSTVFVSRGANLGGRSICSVQAYTRSKRGALVPSGQHHRLLPIEDTFFPDPSMAVSGSFLILAYGEVIEVVNFRTVSATVVTQTLNVGAVIQAIDLEGPLLFVACGPDGLKIFRVGN